MSNASPPVRVETIELPRDAAKFIKAWWPICGVDPHWVPPLVFERKQFLNPAKNPFFKHGRVQCFMAWRGTACVGTISAHIDQSIQAQEPGVGFIGFYEFIDDESVAIALADAACSWLREQGMYLARGPFNFNANHEFGTLVEGFDSDPCIANPTNQSYYDRLYHAAQFAKAKDWYAYWFDQAGPSTYMASVGERFLARNTEVTLRPFDKTNWDEELNLIYDIYNDAWSEQWSHSKVTREEVKQIADGVKPLIEEKLIWFAFVHDEPAAFSLSMPDWNQVVKGMNGRVLPFGWYRLLTGRNKISAMRIWMLGVKRKFQHLPLGVPLYLQTWEEGRKRGFTGAEGSLIIEDNYRMRGALEKLGGRIYKTYRIYERRLDA